MSDTDLVKLAYTLGYRYARLQGQPKLVKKAWVSTALRVGANLLNGGFVAHDVGNQALGTNGMTADKRHARSWGATALRTAGLVGGLFIPGPGWVAAGGALAAGLLGDYLGNKVQARADNKMMQEKQRLAQTMPTAVGGGSSYGGYRPQAPRPPSVPRPAYQPAG